jgi:HD-like signal output (HDOD) protein
MSKVLAICNNPHASANDLNRIIALDPVLTGKVLKLINSAYYSPGEPISSLTRAIIILGVNTVKNLALGSAIMDNIHRHEKLSAEIMNDFWMHSLSTGVIAKILAVHRGVPPTGQEEYFVAGLLHDLGKIPLMSLYLDRYRELLHAGGDDGPSILHDREEAAFGMGHCRIGALIAKKWHLSPQITAALRDHHLRAPAPDEADPIPTLVAAANVISHRLNPQRTVSFPQDVFDIELRLAGIDADVIPAMAGLVNRELEKAKIFLELN